jgi:hypothetical protein
MTKPGPYPVKGTPAEQAAWSKAVYAWMDQELARIRGQVLELIAPFMVKPKAKKK